MATRARKSTAPTQPKDDPFKCGWRFVKRTQGDGTVELEQVPLTLADVLHPEEEDFHIHSLQHEQDCSYLAAILRARSLQPPITLVSSDLRIDWGIEGLGVHGPDIAVFVGLRSRPRQTDGTLYLATTGGRCILAIEIVSPTTRSNDVVVKLDHYHRAKVGFYALVDQEEEDGPRALLGYSRTKSGFKALDLHSDGSLFLSPVGLRLELRRNQLVCLDAATGRPYLSNDQNIVQLEQADHKLSETGKLLEESILLQKQTREEAVLREQRMHQESALREKRLREEFERRFREQEERIRQLETQLKPTKRPNGRK